MRKVYFLIPLFLGSITRVPWSEFSLLGHKLSIGSGEIEILGPIERCSATSVNPASGIVDLNLPSMLASRYGHCFCGLYAHVTKTGSIHAGDQLHKVAGTSIRQTSVSKLTVASLANFPRAMRIMNRVNECQDIVSFTLHDPLADKLPKIAPASYVRLHHTYAGEPVWRSYTISGWSHNHHQLRISVKKEATPAKLSRQLHETVNIGDNLIVSGPFTDMSLTWRPEIESQRPVLILTAGIGITVSTSILATLVREQSTALVRIGHVARNEQQVALWDDVLSATRKLKDAEAYLFLKNSADVEKCDAVTGWINLDQMVKDLECTTVQVFLCGPRTFMVDMKKVLVRQGIADNQIHEDIFTSPSHTVSERHEPSMRGPISVYFTAERKEVSWTHKDGTLLDLAEKSGVSVSANCRSGACRACLRPIEGNIEQIFNPISPAPKGWAYMCCTVPLAPVRIRAC